MKTNAECVSQFAAGGSVSPPLRPRLTALYPGDQRYPFGEKVEVVPLAALAAEGVQ